MSSNHRGFTLVEILMALLLISILAGIAVPQFIDFSGSAATGVTQERLNELKSAIIGDPRLVENGVFLKPGFEAQLGSLPTTLNDLVTQGAYPNYSPFTKKGWRGPYVSNSTSDWNLDSWKQPIVYTPAARTLRSCGPDKVCNNADDIVVTF